MPEINILPALLFGLLLGAKHALDVDHVVAVTAIVSHSKSLLRSVLAGLSWGIGHTLTLFVAGFGVLVFKLTIPDRLALSTEFLVGAMLVLLGIPIIRQLAVSKAHIHVHQHEDKQHLHDHSHGGSPGHEHRHVRRPLLVGMVHGLAGSGMLVPLAISTMSSIVQGLFFLLLFGIGSILGMLVLSGLISLPFKLTAERSLRINLWLQGAAGTISIILGIYIMWQAGFVAGLFLSAT